MLKHTLIKYEKLLEEAQINWDKMKEGTEEFVGFSVDYW